MPDASGTPAPVARVAEVESVRGDPCERKDVTVSSTTPTGRRKRVAALVAAVVVPLTPLTPLTPAPTAHASTAAGTIVFIKNYNVWIARGDGSGARQLSTDGREGNPYRTPSQSSTGLIAAVSYAAITTFDQQGNKIAEIDPPALPGSGGHDIDGTPVALAVSPDGTLIAYSFAETCGSGCGYRLATGYTSSTGATAPGPRGTSFYGDPTWVSNTRTLQSGGFTEEVQIHDVGQSTKHHWFDDADVYGHDYEFGNVDVSPDGKMIAGVGTYSTPNPDSKLKSDIFTLAITGNVATDAPPAEPVDNCQLGDNDLLRLTDPTWGPDSKTLAFERPDGIVTYDGTISPCTNGTEALIAPGGSDPDWSTAPLAEPTMTAKSAPQVSGSAAVGGTLTATSGQWTSPPTAIAYQWLRDGKAIAGATSASYAVKAADAGHRISTGVTVSRTGWPSASSTSAAVSIAKPGLLNVRKPKIAGKAAVGRTLRATAGTWKPAPTRVAFQWLRNGKAIKKATRATYRIGRSDRRHAISVRVTAIRGKKRATAVSKAVTVRR